MNWNGKPYYSFDSYLKETFGEKIYKLSLDGGMTCPNRDGTLGTGGCIFCSHGGSGDFAAPSQPDLHAQIESAKEKVAQKHTGSRYIAYFQSYTNTYAPVEALEALFSSAIAEPCIAGLSIATRPDCLPDGTIELLSRLNRQKPVWVELGLQTIHEETARHIRRGYELPCFLSAFHRLKAANIPVIVHVILGLPTEDASMMLETVSYLGQLPVDGIKLQLLHVLKGTDLETEYQTHPFPIFTLEEYADLIADCIRLLPPDVVIHRISGDGPKSLLIAPAWSANKRLVLNTIAKRLKERNIYQGCALAGATTPSDICTP